MRIAPAAKVNTAPDPDTAAERDRLAGIAHPGWVLAELVHHAALAPTARRRYPAPGRHAYRPDRDHHGGGDRLGGNLPWRP